jgi:NOL1/NOP2/sun family putative RNA methylase
MKMMHRKNLLELPPAFLLKMAQLLGDEYDEFVSSLQQLPLVGLRVNTLKISAEEFTQRSQYSLSPIPWCSCGFLVNEQKLETRSILPGKHPYHTAGVYYLQEPSAMAAAESLSPLPGEKVLDLAAAPGGKATHLASLMKNTGVMVANEIHPRRVWDLAENLERCGITNAIVTNETPQRLADHFGEYFDRVMLDAPCSGEGMFRKSDIARKEWKPDLPSSCAVRQTSIIEQASRMVKPGGSLAYTTCTFSPEENEDVIAGFLQLHPEFQLCSDIQLPGLLPAHPEWIGFPISADLSQAKRIWPHRCPGEGHFIAILRKDGSTEKNKLSTKRIKHTERSSRSKNRPFFQSLMDEFYRSSLNQQFFAEQLSLKGSYIYQIPEETPILAGLKVIHPGWWLGTIQKDRLIPSHALAMGIHSTIALQTIPLQWDDERVPAYLAGESFSFPGENGWVIITVDGFPIGWGKRVQHIIKNYYPHGLRRPLNTNF